MFVVVVLFLLSFVLVLFMVCLRVWRREGGRSDLIRTVSQTDKYPVGRRRRRRTGFGACSAFVRGDECPHPHERDTIRRRAG